MTLTLTMIKTPAGVQIDAQQKVFEPDGGVIGRGAGNDWVLPDPERFLSSKHCQLLHEHGDYFLLDLSTNGTFLNGASEPVGRGNKAALHSGDQIDVGEYRFKVTVERGRASPFDHTDLARTAATTDLGGLGSAQVAPEAMFMSSDYGGTLGDIAPDELKITDPLVALDRVGDPFSTPSAEFASRNSTDPFGSQEDSASLLQESLQWPSAQPEQSVLPDDWDQDISILARRSAKSPPPQSLANEDSLLAKPHAKPLAETSKPAAEPPRPTPSRRAPAPRAPVEPPPAPRPVSAAQPQAPRGLFDALGFADHTPGAAERAELEATIGLMMRETLEGLMQVLRSRTSIKNEFRMNVTTIQSVENNPIKFSVNADEALETMFVRKSRAYKEPVEAVRECFQTIGDHQVAVIAGIRQAFRSALIQFDPHVLEEEFKKSGKGSMVPGLNGAKYWAAYHEHYQSVVNNMERSFQELFGDEFVHAYEDQLRKLAAARKRNN